jgi:hypothetical protein
LKSLTIVEVMIMDKPKIEKIGVLDIPISQWKLGELLMWVQRRGFDNQEPPPISVDVLPDVADIFEKSSTQKTFYAFREILFQDTESNSSDLILRYDRMRVMSDVTPEDSRDPTHTDRFLAEEAAQLLSEEHQIMMSPDYLENLIKTNTAYSSVSSGELLMQMVTKALGK